jgi:transcriptional regulator with GAF, ATPase, and Fis domain
VDELSSNDASVDTLLRLIWRELRKECALDRISISYLHTEGQALILGTVLGRTLTQLRTGFRETLSAEQKLALEDQCVTGVKSHRRHQRRSIQILAEAHFRTVATTPLQLHGQLLGTLDACSTKTKAISREQLASLRTAAAVLALAHERGQFIGRAYVDREVKSRLRRENEQLREVSIQSFHDAAMIGESAVWRRQLQQIQQVAGTD